MGTRSRQGREPVGKAAKRGAGQGGMPWGRGGIARGTAIAVPRCVVAEPGIEPESKV